MEDLWEDINLSSLHHLKPPAPHGVALHEFLGRPFAAQNTPPPPSLSLCSNVPEIHFSCGPADAHTSVLPHHYSVSPDGRRIAASSPVSSGRRKRVHQSPNTPADHRHKRMMKNREAAARSRARKEAHTSALEQEVKLLLKEKSKLIEEYQELRIEADSHKNCKLCRTSSAPF